MDPPVSTGGFGFADPGPDPVSVLIDPSICPERVRSNTDSFEQTAGLQGAASTPSTGTVQAPVRAPAIDFYTDLDFPYDSNLSPIHMVEASRGVNRSQDNYTTYQMQFDQDPNGPSTSVCQFGANIGHTVELCFENIDNHNIYQHRYVLLCRRGTGKIYGLEICPSKNRTIRAFPLLLALKDHNTDCITTYIANPLLRGSLNGEPGNMKSNYDWYVSTSGWLGGGVVSSYPAALCFNDNFHRLTKKSGSHVRGLSIDEVPRAEIQVSTDTRNAPVCPPSIRDYILRQLVAFGASDFSRMDCFSSGPQNGLPIDYPYVDPFLSISNPPAIPRNPPPVSTPAGPWRPYNNNRHTAPPPVQPVPIAPHSLPFQSHCSVVSEGGSALDHSMSEHSSDTTGATIYTAAKLDSDERFRQSVIKRIRDNKSLKLPKVDAEKFLKWKERLIDELRGSAWRPHGKLILKYSSTDTNDPAISRTSNDLTYVLSGCATMQDDQTYSQLISGGGKELLRSGLGIELFHHAVALYSPTGIRATWDGEDSWSKLRHHQSELIDSLSVRIDECALQLNRTSGSLLPYNEFACKLKLAKLVFSGPYGDAFKDVANKMCVVQDADWDISLSSLTYQVFTSKLSAHLKRTNHFTANGLAKGRKITSPAAISANQATLFDKYGKDELNIGEGLSLCRKYWAKEGDSGKTGGCPLCRSKTHSLVSCPVLKQRGLSVTYSESHDENPPFPQRDASGRKITTSPAPASTSALEAKNEKILGLQAQIIELQTIQEKEAPTDDIDDASPPITGKKVAVNSSVGADGLSQFAGWNTVNHSRGNRSNVRSGGSYIDAVNGTNSVSSISRSIHLASRFPITVSHSLANARKVTATSRNVRRRLRSKIDITCYLSQTTCSFIPDNCIKQLCLDSGASHDLWNNRDDFISYTNITTSGRYVSLADDSKIPIMGVGTIQFRIGSKVIRLNNVYHVPRLDMPLLSMRVHRRRAQGCSFIADHSGCFYTFPEFRIEVDDADDVTVPFTSCHEDESPDFCDTRSTRRGRRSRAAARRSVYLQHAIAARRMGHSRPTGMSTPTSSSENSSIPVTSGSAFPPIPNRYVPNSFGPKKMSYSCPQLTELFGCRKLNYNILSHLGTGLEIPLSEEPALSIGDCVNIKRGNRGGKIAPVTTANHTIGVDIGYGDGTSPGGYKYCLLLTCLSTKATWVYGLTDLKGSTIADAFWLYAIDAGSFPKRVRTDFDKRLICGDVARLLRSHGVTIGAAPPHRQSQNGAVERQWQTACCMARSLLAKSRLPKKYWYWAIRESVGRMNLLPVQAGPDPDDAGEFVRITVDTTNENEFVNGSLAYLYFDRPINNDDDEINMDDNNNNNGKTMENDCSPPLMTTVSKEPGSTTSTNTNVTASVTDSTKVPGSTTSTNTNVTGPVTESSCRLANLPTRGEPVTTPLSIPAPSRQQQLPKRRKKSTKQSQFERYSKQAESLATPYELFYGEKPDYRILFPFGCLGYFRKPILSDGKGISNFHSQSVPGIALGRSDFSNAMLFWNPLTSRFSTSADYKLDTEGTLPNVFPGVVYDGMFVSQKLSSSATPKEAFPPGSTVFARVHDEFFEGVVILVYRPIKFLGTTFDRSMGVQLLRLIPLIYRVRTIQSFQLMNIKTILLIGHYRPGLKTTIK